MKIQIRTNVNLPEIPAEVEIEAGTLGDLLARVFGRLEAIRDVVDPATGEIKVEGLFDVRLNDIPAHALDRGPATPLADGDVLRINLLLLGGG